jgi:hypothetical protein
MQSDQQMHMMMQQQQHMMPAQSNPEEQKFLVMAGQMRPGVIPQNPNYPQ